MLGRLRFQRAVEIGLEFSVAALELLDLGLEAADARLDAVLVNLQRGDLGVARGDRRMRARQLSGKPVALRRRVRPAARKVGEADAEVLSLTIERLAGSRGFERKVGRPPRRSGGGRWALERRRLWCGRLDRGRRFFRGLRPPGQPLRHAQSAVARSAASPPGARVCPSITCKPLRPKTSMGKSSPLAFSRGSSLGITPVHRKVPSTLPSSSIPDWSNRQMSCTWMLLPVIPVISEM